MKTSSRVGLILLTGAGVALSASPAGAAPPIGTCPPAFELKNLSQQADLIQEIFPDITREEAEQLALDALPRFDRNDDTVLCFREVGGSRHENFYTVIDNITQGSRP